MTATPWDTPQVRALGEERLRLLREAAEKSKDKTGMERLDGTYGTDHGNAGTVTVQKSP